MSHGALVKDAVGKDIFDSRTMHTRVLGSTIVPPMPNVSPSTPPFTVVMAGKVTDPQFIQGTPWWTYTSNNVGTYAGASLSPNINIVGDTLHWSYTAAMCNGYQHNTCGSIILYGIC